MTGGPDLERVGQRVERLLDEVAAAQPAAAHAAEELVRELLGLYGAGLTRILALLEESSPEAVGSLAEDPLVAGLLTLHDLHPVGVATRVQQAIDEVRPQLGSHGGDVELIGVEGDTVRLRLLGGRDGCGASAVTLEHAVEAAIHAAAPEIERIDVDGAVDRQSSGGLIPLGALHVRRGSGDGPGSTGLDPSDVPDGSLAAREVGGQRIVLGRVGSDLYAYRDDCPACHGSLDGATIDGTTAGCPGCGGRYDVRLAGRGLDADGLALEPVPLVEDLVGIRLALGAAT